jgi:hypothetical protein
MANYQTIEPIKPHTYGGKGTGIVIQMTYHDLIGSERLFYILMSFDFPFVRLLGVR